MTIGEVEEIDLENTDSIEPRLRKKASPPRKGPPRSADDAVALEMAELIADLPSEAKLTVYRTDVKSGRLEWCHTYTDPSDFSEEDIARFGPGRYRLFARAPNPEGKETIVKTRSLSIAARPDQAGAAPGPSGLHGGNMAEMVNMQLLTSLLEGSRQSADIHRALMKSMMDSQHAPKSETPAWVGALIAALAPALVTLLKPQDQAAQLAMFKDLIEISRPASPASSMSDALKLVEQAKDLVSDGDGDANPWIAGLKHVAPMVDKVLDTVRQSRPALAPPPAPTPAPAPIEGMGGVTPPQPMIVNPGPAETVPAKPPTHPLMAQLERMMPYLAGRAVAEPDEAAFYGEWVLRQVAQEHYELLGNVLDRPTVLDELAELFPVVAQHRGWFSGLVDAMRVSLEPEPEPEKGA